MMARNNLTGSEVQMKSHKELLSSPSLEIGRASCRERV